jgi:hypothetical protein
MPYTSGEEIFYVGTETTRGDPLVLDNDERLDCTAESTMEPEISVIERTRYLNSSNGTPACAMSARPGTGQWNANLVCDMKGVDTALLGTTDADFDGHGTSALLQACGHSVTLAAGTRTFGMAGLSTGSSNEQTPCTIVATDAKLMKRAVGCAGNYTVTADGSVARWNFSMQGVYQPPWEDAVFGTGTNPVQDVAPPSHLMGVISIGTLDTLDISSVSFDAGNTVSLVPSRGPLQWPLFSAQTDTDGAGTSILDVTANINDSAGDPDVTVFQTAPTADNDNNTIYFGMKERFFGLKFSIGTSGSTVITTAWEYYNGTTWTALPFGRQQVVDFDEAAGTYYNEWGNLTDWDQNAVNSITAYWVRCRVESFTSNTTSAVLNQAWALVPSYGASRFMVTSRNPKLSIAFDAVDPDTFDPIRDLMEDTSWTVTVPFGTADNNTWILTMTNAFVAEHPTMVEENELRRMGVVFGCQSYSWLLT